METFLIKTVQLLLSLSILVIFHEFGHFIFARMFKVRVEKFYLFFDPWFSLFKFKPKNSYTEYGIGWLPFGGYVKISGMIDESMDREQMSQPPKPWEFRSKPAWQRLLIMVAGVVFNFILAVFIYSMIVYTWGFRWLLCRYLAKLSPLWRLLFFEGSRSTYNSNRHRRPREEYLRFGILCFLPTHSIPYQRKRF